jgi:4-hydroxybutyryl-CoA dehydratase/vinylacetyl-CoA-Delta-isomerase
MIDPKGDRGLGLSARADSDLFLRVVKRQPDGIVVRGAKAHQTGMINSHEIIVMLTMNMTEADKRVCCCICGTN